MILSVDEIGPLIWGYTDQTPHCENPECTDTGSWKPALVPGSWMDFVKSAKTSVSEHLFLRMYVNVDLGSAALVHFGVTKHDGISLPI